MAVIRDGATYKPSEKKSVTATINNSNNTLSGFVNKQVEALNYGGGETDTLIINVDNDKNIITGNVKWQAFLGESDTTAYPGDKGADNHNKIIDLFDALSEEIKRANQSEGILHSKLDSEISERISEQRLMLSKLYELEDLVNKSIRSEVSILSNRIDNLILDVEENKKLSNSIHSELSSSLRQEERRAIAAESELGKRITDSETNLLGKISTLSDGVNVKISAVNDRIDSELDNVETLVEQVDSKITSDYLSRIQSLETSTDKHVDDIEQDIDKLSNLIEIESNDRKSSDTAITSRITNIEADLSNEIMHRFNELSPKIDSNANSIIGLQNSTSSSIKQVSTAVNEVNHRIDLIEPRLAAEANDRKASDDAIVSTLTKNAAESKEYVDSKIFPIEGELLELKESIELISGGTSENIQTISDKLITISNDVDNIDNRLSDETTNRTIEIAKIRSDFILADANMRESITSLQNAISENKKDDDVAFQSITSKFVLLDKTLSDTSSLMRESMNEIEVKLLEEMQSRESSDSNIKAAYKIADDTILKYVDASIDGVSADMSERDSAIVVNLTKQLELATSGIITDVDNLTHLIGILTNRIDDESTNRQTLEIDLKSAISASKEASTDYTDKEIAEGRESIVSSNVSVQQNLLAEIDKVSKSLTSKISGVDVLVNTIKADLSKEVENRLTGDMDTLMSTTKLISDLSSTLTSKIDSLKVYVDSEIQEAIEKLDSYDVMLTQKVNNEILRAKQSEDTLHNEIIGEAINRESGDIALEQDISLLSAHSEERVLSIRSELIGLISDESVRAELAEESILNKFDTFEDTISKEFVHRFTDTDSSLRLYAEQSGEVLPVVASYSTDKSTIVMRDDSGKIPLMQSADDINSFKNSDAVPKLYVDMKASETQDAIMQNVEEIMSFTFIDGGNAPIPKT